MDNEKYTGKLYAYISIGLTAATVVSVGLALTVLGIYALIASVLFGIGAVTFANIQKRKNDFKQLIIIRVCAYIALCIAMLVFLGGMLWSIE